MAAVVKPMVVSALDRRRSIDSVVVLFLLGS
jgi:hypothetical protein